MSTYKTGYTVRHIVTNEELTHARDKRYAARVRLGLVGKLLDAMDKAGESPEDFNFRFKQGELEYLPNSTCFDCEAWPHGEEGTGRYTESKPQ